MSAMERPPRQPEESAEASRAKRARGRTRQSEEAVEPSRAKPARGRAPGGAGEALEAYRAKRALDRTPEPAGAEPAGVGVRSGGAIAGHGPAAPGGVFVVHKHAARNLHFDLRLELGGVLASWAVPKGPSCDPAEKRLAVHVEDHPLEYADFEGVIPEGNYGAGAMIAWDRGAWLPVGDPAEGLEKGKLLFELRGYKLRGLWTLVKIRKSERDWLLIKERDALAAAGPDDFPQESVLSGLSVEELGAGRTPADAIREELDRLGVPRRTVRVDDVEFQLAETRARPFTRAGWIFELKYDGYRMLAAREDDDARLLTRNRRDAAARFPEIARALSALPFDHLVMDGEVVVLDETGRPSFQRLQRRGQLRRAADIRRLAPGLPATMFLFDLLAFEDRDLRGLPLLQRKALLRRVLPRVGPLRWTDHVGEIGEAFYEQVEGMGLEGILAKKADAPYRGGRRRDWIKIRCDRVGDFVVVGWTRPQGSRSGFGALHLGAYDDGRLVYAGRVGSGFSEAQLAEVGSLLERTRRRKPPCEGAPTGRGHHWVEPELVAGVRYKEVTEEGLLRQPVFLGFRDDKPLEECVLERLPAGTGDDGPDAAGAPESGDGAQASGDGRGGTHTPLEGADDVGGAEGRDGARPHQRGGRARGRGPARRVHFTNLDKVFWPEDGYTKGDLIDYYRVISPRMLPYLADRPLVLTRFPDGIHGKSFFQKDAPPAAPGWLRTVVISGEEGERDLRYIVGDDVETLLYVANLGSIPLHVWASRVADLERPDWCILDLDPKDAPFTDVVEIARTVYALCEEIGLPSFVKTSGSSGLHVLVPLGGQLGHEESKLLGELLARVTVAARPDIATMARAVSARAGKVYVDAFQNGRGKLLAAPFSVRPLPGAPVSTPLEWPEVEPGLDIRRFTIRTVPERLRQQQADPMRQVLEATPDLAAALDRLASRVAPAEPPGPATPSGRSGRRGSGSRRR